MSLGQRRRSVGFWVLLFLGLQAVLVTATIGVVGWKEYQRAGEEATSSASASADIAAVLIASSLSELQNTMAEAVQNPLFAQFLDDPNACQFGATDGGGSGVFPRGAFHMVRPDGTLVCSSASDDPLASMFDLSLIEGVGPAPEIVGPHPDPVSGRNAMFLITRVPASGTSLVMSLYTEPLALALADELDSRLEPHFVIVSPEGDELTRSFGTATAGPAPAFFQEALALQGTSRVDADGLQRIYADAVVTDFGWRVFAGVSVAEAFNGARGLIIFLVAVGAASLLLFGAVGLWVRRRVVNPIRTLSRAAHAATEDREARVDVDGPRELSNLATQLNALLEVREDAERILTVQAEDERAVADQLRELEGTRQAFLMAISHELRTPLTSVVGYAELLQDESIEPTTEEVRTYTGRIVAQAQRLESLLIDLLDVERLSRGVTQLRPRWTDVSLLATEAVDRVTRDHSIVVEGHDVWANVDPALIERVVENLVNNALKHTPHDAQVWVRTSREGEFAHIVVEDSGHGVRDELKDKIFEPFEQGDVPEYSPGIGVGLSLVAKFVSLHDGRAWVEDREGGGARFCVELPVGEPEGAEGGADAPATASQRSVA